MRMPPARLASESAWPPGPPEYTGSGPPSSLMRPSHSVGVLDFGLGQMAQNLGAHRVCHRGRRGVM